MLLGTVMLSGVVRILTTSGARIDGRRECRKGERIVSDLGAPMLLAGPTDLAVEGRASHALLDKTRVGLLREAKVAWHDLRADWKSGALQSEKCRGSLCAKSRVEGANSLANPSMASRAE